MSETCCKRCGANEDRINGFCSVECEEYYRLEEEIDALDNVILERGAAIGRLTARIAELEGEIAKMKKYFHKPAHGTCCTCQKCGHTYDECRCDFDEALDDLDKANARIAELEAVNDQLIEAGNTMVFETFEGYKKHGLFDFAPVNTWQVLVKDWLVKERER